MYNNAKPEWEREMDNTAIGLIVMFFLICVIVTGLQIALAPPIKEYDVEIIFCDKRESIVTRVRSSYYPTQSDIHTPTESQPYYYYGGYNNVCSIRVISKILK